MIISKESHFLVGFVLRRDLIIAISEFTAILVQLCLIIASAHKLVVYFEMVLNVARNLEVKNQKI